MKYLLALGLCVLSLQAQALPILAINSFQTSTGPVTPLGSSIDLAQGSAGGVFSIQPEIFDVEEARVESFFTIVFPGAVLNFSQGIRAFNDEGNIEVLEFGGIFQPLTTEFIFDGYKWSVMLEGFGQGDEKEFVLNTPIFYGDAINLTYTKMAVPEPGTVGLLLGVVGLHAFSRRFPAKRKPSRTRVSTHI